MLQTRFQQTGDLSYLDEAADHRVDVRPAGRAPYAVHRTVGWIRDNYPGLPSVWAAYVHAGA